MSKHLSIDCHSVMDIVYEADKSGSLSILTQIRIWLHLLFCPYCSQELRRLRCLEEIMETDFFPPSPDFSETIMKHLALETGIEEKTDAPAGFSFRGWVITGFFVLLSLSTSFFGMNFIEIADTEGLSFLLPVGLTFGIVLTCYGSLFIASHLKELSMRFRLR